MRKIVSLLLVVIFASTFITSCVDAQADEIYENIVPEKTKDGENSGHNTSGPG